MNIRGYALHVKLFHQTHESKTAGGVVCVPGLAAQDRSEHDIIQGLHDWIQGFDNILVLNANDKNTQLDLIIKYKNGVL